MKKIKCSLWQLVIATSLLTITSCETEDQVIETPTEESEAIIEEREAGLTFNKSKDLLLAQFDNKPDADDIHSVAALGCMLRHSDLSGVKYYAVQGAYGIQGGKYIEAKTLYNKIFGSENEMWTDAHKNRNSSIDRVKSKVKATLDNGGKVWVQEAGQSNFTRDWVNELISDGVSESKIKSNVIVVQHSKWNESKTTSSDLKYVKNKTKYVAIDDGNNDFGEGENRGPNTPSFNTKTKSFLKDAMSSSNKNTKARDYWRIADDIVDDSGFNSNYSPIPDGGVDFSDCVENYYIFETNSIKGVSSFWKRYVVNNPN